MIQYLSLNLKVNTRPSKAKSVLFPTVLRVVAKSSPIFVSMQLQIRCCITKITIHLPEFEPILLCKLYVNVKLSSLLFKSASNWIKHVASCLATSTTQLSAYRWNVQRSYVSSVVFLNRHASCDVSCALCP